MLLFPREFRHFGDGGTGALEAFPEGPPAPVFTRIMHEFPVKGPTQRRKGATAPSG